MVKDIVLGFCQECQVGHLGHEQSLYMVESCRVGLRAVQAPNFENRKPL